MSKLTLQNLGKSGLLLALGCIGICRFAAAQDAGQVDVNNLFPAWELW